MSKRNRSSSTPNDPDSSSRESDGTYYRRKYEKTLRDLKEMCREERLRLDAKKARLDDDTLEAFVARTEKVFTQVLDAQGNLLFLQADFKLQQIFRALLDELACRWSKLEHVPVLNLKAVKVRDDKPFLAKAKKSPGADPIPYAAIYLDLILAAFGDPEGNKVLQDFVNRLSTPGLDIVDFQNLYFHQLLQSMTEIAFFPLDAVYKLWDLQDFFDGRHLKSWEDAYEGWVQNEYGQGKGRVIDLGNACLKDPYADALYKRREDAVYKHREKPYKDTPAGEAVLVRNLVTHIFDYRKEVSPRESLDSWRVAQAVHTVAPHIGKDLYGFLYQHRVNMDFRGKRTLYTECPDRYVPLKSDEE